MKLLKPALYGIVSTLVLAASHSVSAATVDFNMTQVTGTTNIGTSAMTVGVGTTTLTSSTGFTTATAYADSSAPFYDGPAVYGGAYRQVTYENVQGAGDSDNWYLIRTTFGFQSRRNGANPTVSGTARSATLFGLDETSMIDSSSTITINLAEAGNPAPTLNAYLFVESAGTLYRSTLVLGTSGANENISGLDTAVFQPVTVDGSTIALTDTGSTVLGSSLTSITQIGAYAELIAATGGGQELRLTLFQANLSAAAVPEPASLALMVCGGLAILTRPRRRGVA